MSDSYFDQRVYELSKRIEPLQKLISAISNSLPRPLFYDSGIQHFGFRYGKPGIRHFCLLKSIRAISGLNASLELTRLGYTQELYVILRTVLEFKSHIEYVLSGLDADGRLRSEVQKHIDEYFSDYQRNSPSDFKRPQLRQREVHNSIGAMYSADIEKVGGDIGAEKTSNLLSNIYLNFSNYVHGRYPEIMDLFGGDPLKFHLRGMSGTPKDQENFDMVEVTLESVSTTLVLLIQKLGMQSIIRDDPSLKIWFNSHFAVDR